MISSVGLNPPGSDAWLVTVSELAGKPHPLEPVTATSPVTLRTQVAAAMAPDGAGRHLANLQRGLIDRHHEPHSR